jgi:Phage stabilisation protein
MLQKLAGFVGQAYNLKNKQVNAQRMVNLYPEMDESGSAKEGQIAYLKSTNGYNQIMGLGSGPIRLIHFDGLQNDDGTYLQLNRIFVVSGNQVFRLTYDSFGWDTLLLGELGTYTGSVSAASLSIDYGVTIFVDGSNENYVYHKIDAATETFQTFTAAGYSGVQRATQVYWLDGFIIWIVKDSNKFYISQWNTITVDPLDFASAEGDPDSIVAVISNHRDLWLLNERSVEIHANTGNADFPFERVQGGFIENGCLAAFSVCKISGMVFWLGRDKNGQGIVYAAASANHQRISTHAIEYAITTYANPELATAYTYQKDGHIFYCLNFSEASWCYDLTTKSWHERAFTNNGLLERHRAEWVTFFPNFGQHIFGDYENGNIYAFNDNTFTDNGSPITRLRSTPHISNNRNLIQFKKLELDMQFGVGLDGDPSAVGADPQVMMRFSNDGGFTWSSERWLSFGKIGEFKKRVRWMLLGASRDRVFEVKVTDPVNVIFIAAELDAEACSR